MRRRTDSWAAIRGSARTATSRRFERITASPLHSSEPARHANVAIAIARRPFLSGEEAPWIEGWRAKLTATVVRALRELITISAANREPAVAIQHAEEMLEVES